MTLLTYNCWSQNPVKCSDVVTQVPGTVTHHKFQDPTITVLTLMKRSNSAISSGMKFEMWVEFGRFCYSWQCQNRTLAESRITDECAGAIRLIRRRATAFMPPPRIVYIHSTEWMEWMSHRKRRETKQQPSMLPGPAVPGCCLVSFHFQCDILSI